jgi:hypothetical protein
MGAKRTSDAGARTPEKGFKADHPRNMALSVGIRRSSFRFPASDNAIPVFSA